MQIPVGNKHGAEAGPEYSKANDPKVAETQL